MDHDVWDCGLADGPDGDRTVRDNPYPEGDERRTVSEEAFYSVRDRDEDGDHVDEADR
ncbi:hypothetical protein [Aureimonas sp. AU22]|uniref:hypothetical protein n=1 Tax=Aureimonas sp. AU22 TaxID=1638162 RepID=UPI000ADD13A5|nr:hypothetical protein [Aureimonas sp. AU22]